MTLGTSLRTLRQLRGLSLNELATRLSSHVGNLSKIERDLAKPSLDFLYQIAKALDFKLHEIFRLAERDDSPDERQAALDALFLVLLDDDKELLVEFASMLKERSEKNKETQSQPADAVKAQSPALESRSTEKKSQRSSQSAPSDE